MMIDEESIQGQVKAKDTCNKDVKPLSKRLKHTTLGKQITTANIAFYLRHKEPHWHIIFLALIMEVSGGRYSV